MLKMAANSANDACIGTIPPLLSTSIESPSLSSFMTVSLSSSMTIESEEASSEHESSDNSTTFSSWHAWEQPPAEPRSFLRNSLNSSSCTVTIFSSCAREILTESSELNEMSISSTGKIGGNIEELLSGMEEEGDLNKLKMDRCVICIFLNRNASSESKKANFEMNA